MPNFFFQRYVNGERMADDVLITKQQTLEAAIPEALRLCRNSPKSVLVHIAEDSSLREENARLRAELCDAHEMLRNQARTIQDYQDAAALAAIKETAND